MTSWTTLTFVIFRSNQWMDFSEILHNCYLGDLLGVSPGSKLCTTFLNIAKHDEIMTKIQFNGTATKPHRNRQFRQFNNYPHIHRSSTNDCLSYHLIYCVYMVKFLSSLSSICQTWTVDIKFNQWNYYMYIYKYAKTSVWKGVETRQSQQWPT